MTELLIKNVISEIIFNNKLQESLDDHYMVDYLYDKMLCERLLYGEPVSIDELREILRKKIVNFKFIKLDGEIRPAKGTLRMDYVPKTQHPKGIRPSSPKVATFYDLEKKDWRSVSQRSKEIVLDKDPDTGKPVIMVTDKNVDDDKQTTQPEITIDGVPIDSHTNKNKVEVKNVKPIKSTEMLKTYYLINPVIGASKTIDSTDEGIINVLKSLDKNWKLVSKEEYDADDESIVAASEKTPDVIQIGDVRNYLTNNGNNIELEFINNDNMGGFIVRTKSGHIFKVPVDKLHNIGELVRHEDVKNTSNKPYSENENIIDDKIDIDKTKATDI